MPLKKGGLSTLMLTYHLNFKEKCLFYVPARHLGIRTKYCTNTLVSFHRDTPNVRQKNKFSTFYARRRASSLVCSWITGWMIVASNPGGDWELSLRHRVHTGSGAHPVLYPMGTRDYFPVGVKRMGCEPDHSPPSSAEVKE